MGIPEEPRGGPRRSEWTVSRRRSVGGACDNARAMDVVDQGRGPCQGREDRDLVVRKYRDAYWHNTQAEMDF